MCVVSVLGLEGNCFNYLLNISNNSYLDILEPPNLNKVNIINGKILYRKYIRRTKVTEIMLDDETFVRREFSSDALFVYCVGTKVLQKSDKVMNFRMGDETLVRQIIVNNR